MEMQKPVHPENQASADSTPSSFRDIRVNDYPQGSGDMRVPPGDYRVNDYPQGSGSVTTKPEDYRVNEYPQGSDSATYRPQPPFQEGFTPLYSRDKPYQHVGYPTMKAPFDYTSSSSEINEPEKADVLLLLLAFTVDLLILGMIMTPLFFLWYWWAAMGFSLLLIALYVGILMLRTPLRGTLGMRLCNLEATYDNRFLIVKK